MIIPESVWALRLRQGDTLGSRVKRSPPAVVPMTERDAFASVWKIRLNDAMVSGNKNMESRAKALLSFLDEHGSEDLVMLIWVDTKTVAIMAPVSGEAMVVD
jgi:hypothetical protein